MRSNIITCYILSWTEDRRMGPIATTATMAHASEYRSWIRHRPLRPRPAWLSAGPGREPLLEDGPPDATRHPGLQSKYTPRRNTSVSCSRPRCLRWVCRAAYLSKSSRKSSASRLICLRSPSLASGVSRPASLATSARYLRRSLSLTRRPSSCLRFRSICARILSGMM